MDDTSRIYCAQDSNASIVILVAASWGYRAEDCETGRSSMGIIYRRTVKAS